MLLAGRDMLDHTVGSEANNSHSNHSDINNKRNILTMKVHGWVFMTGLKFGQNSLDDPGDSY